VIAAQVGDVALSVDLFRYMAGCWRRRKDEAGAGACRRAAACGRAPYGATSLMSHQRGRDADAYPSPIGSTGWVRSSACPRFFSFTHMTNALSGQLR
jgi:hypothetical protein